MLKKIIIINIIFFILNVSYCNAESTSNLEILAIENEILYPAFDNEILEYNVEVSNDVTKLNIFAVPEDEEGEVEIKGENNILEGNNSIFVIVRSSSNNKKEYKINVYKRNLEEEKEYVEKENQKKEKLEEAYKISETEQISEIEGLSKTNKTLYSSEKTKVSTSIPIKINAKKLDFAIIVLTIILLIIAFIITMKKYKLKKINNKKQ